MAPHDNFMEILSWIIASVRDGAKGAIVSIISGWIHFSHEDVLQETVVVKDKPRFGMDLCDERTQMGQPWRRDTGHIPSVDRARKTGAID
jgi:hypothetical protein